ncbi:hypothetical protein AO919_32880, partial [Pseudomonas aeruginosa]|uniref:transposase n=1 Tax=Pseudomonas aeruginosa TaxID=287 RepID=UPI00128FC0AB
MALRSQVNQLFSQSRGSAGSRSILGMLREEGVTIGRFRVRRLMRELGLVSKQRRTFSAEFKREAAALVLDQGYSHIDACRSLGVVDSALRRWVKQLEAERQGVTPKSKALTPEQQKIQELEARINRLER